VAVNKEIKRLEKSNVSLCVTVPKEDVRAQYNNMLKEYTKSLQIPGFRKGKVPQEVLERKFGESLRSEAVGRIIESSVEEIFKDENIPRNEKPLPYSAPQLQEEDLKLDFEKDLSFTVIYDVLPDVKIGQWKGLSVEYPYAEIGKEEIDRELDEIRDRNAIVMDRDDGEAAVKGNVVTIDYQIMDEDGVTPLQISRNDMTFTIDGKNVFKFDDQITGMKKGGTKEFVNTFGGDFFDHSLAGKNRKVKITLTGLKEKKLPDLDDDLAQDVDEKYSTLDDLKNSIKERLSKNLDYRIKDKKMDSLLKAIMGNTPVIIPESMVKTEVAGRIRRLARYYDTDAELMMKMMTDEREKEWRESAEKALHSRLIIETLMEEQKIEVTDEDVEKEFESIAAANGAEVEEVKKHYDEQAVFSLREDIREKKITDLLLSENNLKPGKKENYLDFMSDNG